MTQPQGVSFAESSNRGSAASRPSRLSNAPSTFDVDKYLADALLDLNFDDRLAIQEEIHGVRCGAVEETPELVERSLTEFDERLNARKEQEPNNRLFRNITRVYSLGSSTETPKKPNCYLNDPDVRLRFLRCECFAIEKAVQRMVSFLEFTADLFGDYVAERPIQLSDFNTREEELALQNSRNQLLPFRDRSGRRVLVGVGNCNFHLNYRLRNKILIYLHWVASEDIETQRKGIVIVGWLFDEDGGAKESTWERAIRPTLRKRFRAYHQKHNASLPLREACVHHCFKNTPFFYALSAMYVFGLDSRHQTIFRRHAGAHTELLYTLSTYGIPHDLMPVSSTGKVKTAAQSIWVNGQRAKMRNESNDEIVECPRSVDVVFKQGPAYKSNPGNIYFRDLIQLHCDRHLKANKDQKYEITVEIMENIEERKGRFLEWSKADDVWIVCKDRSKTRTKIASALKQHNRQRKESRQLKATIENAVSVITDTNPTTNSPDTRESKRVDDSLKRYYSAEYVYNSKRRKAQMFCDFDRDRATPIGDMRTTDDGSNCFGRPFHVV